SLDGNLLDLLNPELVEEDPEKAIVERSRLLMFDVLRFVEHHRYRAVVVENVVDIATNPKFAPEWALWRKGLRNLGYEFRVVSLNSMHAQAHGDPAPQSRDRLYIVCWQRGEKAPDIDRVLSPRAWCPNCGEVINARQTWKNGRTVGKYRSQYVYLHAACGAVVEPGYLPAAAAIDCSMRGKKIGERTKPLADKTRRRIAAGIAKYWAPFHMEQGGNQYDAADPKHPAYGTPNGYYRAWSMYDVLRTLHTQETKALVVPLEGRAGDRVKSTDEVLRTQASRHLDALAMPPFIAELRGGGSDARPASQPLSTVTASGNHHGLVVPAGGTWNDDARSTSEPHRTMTTRDTSALLTPYYGSAESSKPASEPVGTLTTKDRYALITRHNSSKDADSAEMTTPASEYMRTLTTTAQQSVITPGDIEAAEAQVDDCLFRMLEPHEVAAGMAFPADYIWGGTRRERVKLAGNAVTPPAARDLIAAVVEALT
ncbi:MAG: DNA cytosine methyltransferase, partial [Pseudonocardiaceae bacterium]